MRILNEDRTNSVAGGTALSGFPASNVQNDRPRKPWISTTQASETFTISLNASSGYPVQAMFLHGLLADSCTWALKNNAGSTVDSGTLDCSFPAESNLSGNPNNMNVSFGEAGDDNPSQKRFSCHHSYFIPLEVLCSFLRNVPNDAQNGYS